MIRGDPLNAQVKQIKKCHGQINIILKNNTSYHQDQQLIKKNPFSTLDKHFSSLIGMDNIKQSLIQIYAMEQINNQRKAHNLKTTKQVYHMLFSGNPGTGKTTVARKLASIFYEIGVLPKNQILEVDRSELVGEYIGQTAQKTRSIIKKALGGVLFIDEAYSLARGGEKDFGKEAIDTLVKYMEDYSTKFVLILAGYPREMNYFLSLNPGLKSRFPFLFTFPDYTEVELIHIAKGLLNEREYKLTREAELQLKKHISKEKLNNKDFSNGRYIRNIIEKAIRHHAVRLMYENDAPNEKQLSLITVKDLKLI